MPGMDGTGPTGRGPMSGWGRGNCILPLQPFEQATERGLKRGLGSRRGRYQAAGKAGALRQEITLLRKQVIALQRLMDNET